MTALSTELKHLLGRAERSKNGAWEPPVIDLGLWSIEHAEDIIAAVSASSTSRDPACPTCAERAGQLVAALEALREIAKGEGAFSRDPLTHASNTIDAMKAIASAALAAPPRPRDPGNASP